MDQKEIIAYNLKRLLKERNKKAIDMSNSTGISNGILSGYLNAKNMPRMGKIEKMAEFLNVDTTEITNYTPNLQKELGEKIIIAREEKNMTQQDLADALGTSKSTISKWENEQDQPNMKDATKMADILDKPLNYFASDSWIGSLSNEEIAYLPILGNVTSLKPLMTTENISHYMERLRKVVPKHVTFVVVADDNAIVTEGAEVMMIESEDAPDDYIVAFVEELGQKPKLRKIKHIGEQIMFYSNNSNYPPIIKTKEESNIIGLAKRIIIDL